MPFLNFFTCSLRITVFYFVLYPTIGLQEYAVFKIMPDLTVLFSNSTETTTSSIIGCGRQCGQLYCDYFSYGTLNRTCEYGISKMTYNSLSNKNVQVGHKLYSILPGVAIPPNRYIAVGSFSQEEARAECEQNGDILVIIKSQEDFDMVHQMIIDEAPNDYVWIGLTYNTTLQKYQWDNGEVLVFDNQSLWGDSEPNQVSTKLCVVFNEEERLLDTKSCTTLQYALCSML